MLASSKHKYSKILAFPDTYYELIINVLQSVELFCAYGSLSWPRTTKEAADLTEEQFNYLMLGLNPPDPKIKDVTPQKPF